MENFLTSDIAVAIWKNIPFFIPVITGLVVCIIDLIWKEEDKDILVYVAVIGLSGLVFLLWRLWLVNENCYFLGSAVSRFNISILIFVSVLSILSIMVGADTFSSAGRNVSNYIIYNLFAAFGIMSALATNNLLVMAIGLSITSISLTYLIKLYGLVADDKNVQKFWIYMVVTDLLFFLGVAFFYGATGRLSIDNASAIIEIVNEAYMGNYFRIGLAVLGVVLTAKMAIVPFHWWIIDFSDLNSAPVINSIVVFYRTAVMLIAIIIFAPLVKIWGTFLEIPIAALAVVTMSWANLAAFKAKDLKLLLIYSSLAHAGYFLAVFPALIIKGGGAETAMLVFVVAFALVHLGCFALLNLFMSEGGLKTDFANIDGLGRRHPWISLVLCLFLFALAGMPPLITFIARLMILKQIAISGNYFIMGAVIINMAVAVFYYLRPMARMFVLKPTKYAVAVTEIGYALVIVVVFTALAAVYLGIQPASLINLILVSVSAS